MVPPDRHYLDSVLAAYIETSIVRATHSGEMIFRYRLTEDEIRLNVGRPRLHDRFMIDMKAFFRNSNVAITHDPKFGIWDVTLDLNRCVLNQAQAVQLSTAIKGLLSDVPQQKANDSGYDGVLKCVRDISTPCRRLEDI